MSSRRWSKFWWQDWQRDPALRMCSPAARGVWLDMLCVMADSTTVGHLLVNAKQPSVKQLASVFGVPEKEASRLIDQLEENGVFSRDGTGTIYSRRMVRDDEESRQGRESVSKRWGNRDDRPNPIRDDARAPNRSPNSSPNSSPKREPTTLEPESESEAKSDKKESFASLSHGESEPAQPAGRVRVVSAGTDPFDEFYAVYPRKVGRDEARKAFASALKRAFAPDIISGVKRQRWNDDPKFIPYPATWLNRGSWSDDPEAAALKEKPKPGRLDWTDDYFAAANPPDPFAGVTIDMPQEETT